MVQGEHHTYQLPAEMEQIRRVCQLHDLDFELIDKHSGYLAQITRGEKTIQIGVNFISAFPINSSTAHAIATDKGYAKQVMASAGISVPRGEVFFGSNLYAAERNAGRSIADAQVFARQLGYPVIAKPAKGAKGNFVQPVYDDLDLAQHLRAMSRRYHAALVEEIVEGQEFRAFVLDGTVRFAYRKAPQEIRFESVESFETAMASNDTARNKLGLNPINRDSGHFVHMRADAEAGKVIHNGILNLFSGNASAVNFTTTIPETVTQLSQQVAHALNLRAFGFDFIAPAPDLSSISDPSTCQVIDVNSNPMLRSLERLGHTHLLESIWQEVIDKSFDLV